uniref:Sensory neuron membrane protein 1 n=1 Tax=Holotrichia parallela TaxID=93412 RepID=A0A2P1ERN0_HOLPA|nr:sensory neuron membrane protein 1 [Holotrichia parallela]
MVILDDIFPDSQWFKRRDNIRNLIFCWCCPKVSVLLALYRKANINRLDLKKMQFPARLALASGIILTCITIFGWVAFPNLIKSKIKTGVTLKPGSELREMYMKIPFAITFKIYVFNVTNPDDVAKGLTPIVQEVGPYMFEEWRSKVFVSEDEEDDTMTFYSKETFIFRPDQSSPLTGNEVLTIPHPLIVAILLTVVRDKPSALNLINKAMNSIFKNPKTPFLTATFKQIFFDGVIVNCSVPDFAGKAVCTQLKTEGAKDFEFIEENVFKFSLLGTKNGTASNKYKVKRGLKNYRDTGRVIEYNDMLEMNVWPTKECNQFQGTEGTIFPGLTPHGSDIPSFAAMLCRSMAAKYLGDTKYNGIPVSRYTLDFGDQTNNPEDKCYCPSPEECMKKGVMDLRKCSGPVVASMPHFYNCDPSYANGVKGVYPDKDKHELYLLFETTTGSPLAARNRLQFSMPLMPIPKVDVMKNCPNTLLPMFWVEESIDLNKTMTKPIKTMFVTMKTVRIISWIILLGTIGGLIYAAFLYYKRSREVHITPVKSVTQKKDNPISTVMSKSAGGVSNPAVSDNEIDKY